MTRFLKSTSLQLQSPENRECQNTLKVIFCYSLYTILLAEWCVMMKIFLSYNQYFRSVSFWSGSDSKSDLKLRKYQICLNIFYIKKINCSNKWFVFDIYELISFIRCTKQKCNLWFWLICWINISIILANYLIPRSVCNSISWN